MVSSSEYQIEKGTGREHVAEYVEVNKKQINWEVLVHKQA